MPLAGVLPPDALWRAWSAEPAVAVPLLVALALYGRGVRRLWARAAPGRGVTRGQVGCFALGAAALGAALLSPLDRLGATLLSAHMAQHGLLMAAAPPLLLAGKPGVALAWGLPDAGRALLGAAPWRVLAGASERLSRPLPAAGLHGLALWGWHAPAAFDAAVAGHAVHVLQHLSFLGTGLLFWRAILDGWNGRRAGAALVAAFATLVHGGLLGGLITMAPRPLYRCYVGRTEAWGLTPLEDQQLAGLLMWVPLGVVYLAACVALASRFVAPGHAARGAGSGAAPRGPGVTAAPRR